MNALRWILSLILAGLFVYMAVFKFLPEVNGSVNPVFPVIAKNTGFAFVEPYFRWLTGAMEIITALLLLVPATRRVGAGLGLMILIGALVAHFTPILGIEVEGAGKTVFYMAIVMTVLSVIVLAIGGRRKVHVDDHHRVEEQHR